MEANGVQGLQVGGREPKALLMSDGTRLALEDEGPGGRADWMLLGDDGAERELSVADAIRMAGDRHAGLRADQDPLRGGLAAPRLGVVRAGGAPA